MQNYFAFSRHMAQPSVCKDNLSAMNEGSIVIELMISMWEILSTADNDIDHWMVDNIYSEN